MRSSSSTRSRLRLGVLPQLLADFIIWKTAAPPLAWRWKHHHEQRGALPERLRRRRAVRTLGLVGIVGQRRGVMLGDDRHVVGGHAQQPAPAPAVGPLPRPPPAPRPGAGIECARRRRTTARTPSPRQHQQPHPRRQVPRGPTGSSHRLGLRRSPDGGSHSRENFSRGCRGRVMDVSAVAARVTESMMPSASGHPGPPATTS